MTYIIDNFLTEDEYKITEQQIIKHFPDLTLFKRNDDLKYSTFEFDEYYINNREEQPIFNIFHDKIWSDNTNRLIENNEDLTWKLFNLRNTYVMTLRSWYGNGYDWHYDINCTYDMSSWSGQIAAFIWYYKPKDSYTGGDLEIEKYGKIEPKDNRLVLLSATHKHKIHDTVMKDGYDLKGINGRVTIMGSIFM